MLFPWYIKYPNQNDEILNLDWIISTIDKLVTEVSNFVSLNTIKYANPIQWNITKQYEKNTVVVDPITGTAYLSSKPVPSGVGLNNTDYWSVIFTLDIISANKNITLRDDANNVLATFTSEVGDWLLSNGTLYKVIRDIDIGSSYVVDYNIERFTVEMFLKEYINSVTNFVNSLVGDLDDLTTSDKTNIVAAINALSSTLGTYIDTLVGDLDDLTTSDKTNIVGAVNSIVDKFVYLNVLELGIDNTGVTPITATDINNIITTAATDNKIIYFPAGVYTFAVPFNIPNTTKQIICSPRAVFDFDGVSGDGVVLQQGYYTNTYTFGEIKNSQGAGIKFFGAETVVVNFKFIHDCAYGIQFDARNTTNKRVSGNVINGDFITLCQAGLHFIGDSYEQEMQQNTFNIHVINTCDVGIYFQASTAINWAYITFNIGTIFAEPGQTNSKGIICDNAGSVNHMVFNIYEIYGGFNATETLKCQGADNVFKLAYLQTYTNTYEINVQGYSCYFENLYVGDGLDVPKANKYSNILGMWNNGHPLCGSNFDLDLPVETALSAGNTLDLYFYHSFAFGYSENMQLIPSWANAPMICTCIEDESVRYGIEGVGGVQRQIHIRLLALGNVAVGDYRCRIKFNG